MKKYFLYLICLLLSACLIQVKVVAPNQIGIPSAISIKQVSLVPSDITRAPKAFDMELKTTAVIIANEAAQTGKVMMDSTVPSLWRDSIQTVVEQAGLFKDDAAKKVTISTLITKFESNNNTCDAEATYTLVDRRTGQTIFEKHITTTASDNVDGTSDAEERFIKLWNKAAQENIAKFVDALVAISLSSSGESSMPVAGEMLVSIAEFKNLSEISEYDWLSIGIPELASTFLSRMKGISLVERTELKRFLDERELELSGLISNSTQSEQLLLGAQYIVLGSYRISGNNVDINARMIKTETGKLLRAESVVGEIGRIGELVQNLTLRMSGALGHKLTAEERTRIQQDSINMLKTIKAISQGQLFYEAGKFDKARAVYKEALRENRGNAELLERIKDIDVTLNAISVVAFKNNSGKHEYDYLSNAIPESLSTSLIKKTGLPFAERLNLKKALEEIEIGMTGIVEPATAASVGKLAGATQLVIGSFQVHDTNLTVFAKIIDTENGLVAANETTTGNISDVPRIANDLADKLVGTLSSVRVTKEAKRSIGRLTEQMSSSSKKIALILEESMVEFDFNQATLKPSSYQVLNLLSDALINFPEYRIVIIGHTDSEGTEEYNEQLSSNRAKSVLQYMKSRSVSAHRMTSIGYGETKPRDSNDTPEGRTKNRRVEYELIKQ